MKFRKTALIEAVQWQPGTTVPGVCEEPCPVAGNYVLHDPHVHTLEGVLAVSPGDWIATGAQSERRPIKPDVFAATYAPADSAPRGERICRDCGTVRFCAECSFVETDDDLRAELAAAHAREWALRDGIIHEAAEMVRWACNIEPLPPWVRLSGREAWERHVNAIRVAALRLRDIHDKTKTAP